MMRRVSGPRLQSSFRPPVGRRSAESNAAAWRDNDSSHLFCTVRVRRFPVAMIPDLNRQLQAETPLARVEAPLIWGIGNWHSVIFPRLQRVLDSHRRNVFHDAMRELLGLVQQENPALVIPEPQAIPLYATSVLHSLSTYIDGKRWQAASTELQRIQTDLAYEWPESRQALRDLGQVISHFSRVFMAKKCLTLGAVMWLGVPGVGKRSLARAFAQRTFGPQGFYAFDGDHFNTSDKVREQFQPGRKFQTLYDWGCEQRFGVMYVENFSHAADDFYRAIAGEGSTGVQQTMRGKAVILADDFGMGERYRRLGRDVTEEVLGMVEQEVRESLPRYFEDCGLNDRVSAATVFAPVSTQRRRAIVERFFEHQIAPRLSERGFRIAMAPEALDAIAGQNDDRMTVFGVEGLPAQLEVVSNHVLDLYFRGELQRGETVQVGVDVAGALVYTKLK